MEAQSRFLCRIKNTKETNPCLKFCYLLVICAGEIAFGGTFGMQGIGTEFEMFLRDRIIMSMYNMPYVFDI